MRKLWKIDGIDVRVPLLIIIPLGFMAVMQVGGSSVGQSSSSGAAITGTASVIDGDTIEIHRLRIRFDGIDAPESGQTCRSSGRDLPCGRQAALHLADRIGRRPVSCEPHGTDHYGRTLAICFEGGEDLNGMMVRDGHAVAYRSYSDRYVPEEGEARRVAACGRPSSKCLGTGGIGSDEALERPVTEPTRIQLRRAKGWRMPENTVVVSRPTPWGNPFVVGKFGDAAKCVESYRALLKGTVCLSSPRVDVDEQLALLRHVRDHLDELRGKNLACWCKIGRPCHADVLLELANR